MKKETTPAKFRLDHDAFVLLKDMFEKAKDDITRIYSRGRMQNIQKAWPQFIKEEEIPQ